MVLFTKCSPEYFLKIYLTLPKFMVNRKVRAIGGDQRTTDINVNLFNFHLTKSPLYVMIELGFIIGIGIKLIDKGRR